MTKPTAQEQEERRARAARAVRGVFAGTLVLEALTVLFVPRAVARVGSGLTTTKLVVSLILVVALIATAAMVRRRYGLAIGTVLQLALIASGLLTGAMYILGVIFAGIWAYELKIRNQLLNL